MSNPSNVDLVAGVYTLPGSSYLLILDGPGAHLRLPSAGPPSLLDLVAPSTPAPPPSPSAAPAATAPRWMFAIAAALVGVVLMGAYERWANPEPSPSPAPSPVVPPGPAPAPTPTPTPKRPDWLPTDAPPTPMEWRVLESDPRYEGYGRLVDGRFLIETWRLKRSEPRPMAAPPAMPPAIIYRGECPPGASQ